MIMFRCMHANLNLLKLIRCLVACKIAIRKCRLRARYTTGSHSLRKKPRRSKANSIDGYQLPNFLRVISRKSRARALFHSQSVFILRFELSSFLQVIGSSNNYHDNYANYCPEPPLRPVQRCLQCLSRPRISWEVYYQKVMFIYCHVVIT